MPDQDIPADTPHKNPDSQDPVLSPFYNWKLVKKDPVQYKDQFSRGLTFVMGLVREATNPVMDSPLNKLVSIYQKPGGDGDFVIVARAANNENDVRIFELTNDTYGELGYPDDPMDFLRRVIEMADGSGMHRAHAEFGDYGKTGAMIPEFAGGLDDEFTNLLAAHGIKRMDAKPPTASVITAGGKPALQAAATAAPAPSDVPSLSQRITAAAGSALAGIGKSALSTAAALSTPGAQVSGGKLAASGAMGMGKSFKQVFFPKSKTSGIDQKKELETHRANERIRTGVALTAAKATAQEHIQGQKLGVAQQMNTEKNQTAMGVAKVRGQYGLRQTETRGNILSPRQIGMKDSEYKANINRMSGFQKKAGSTIPAAPVTPAAPAAGMLPVKLQGNTASFGFSNPYAAGTQTPMTAPLQPGTGPRKVTYKQPTLQSGVSKGMPKQKGMGGVKMKKTGGM